MNPIDLLLPMLIGAYKSKGRDAAARMLTIPEKTLAKIQAKNRDELSEAIQKRDEAVEKFLDLVEELANLDDD